MRLTDTQAAVTDQLLEARARKLGIQGEAALRRLRRSLQSEAYTLGLERLQAEEGSR